MITPSNIVIDLFKYLKRIKELEDIMSSPNFWDNQRESEKVITELNNLKKSIDFHQNRC